MFVLIFLGDSALVIGSLQTIILCFSSQSLLQPPGSFGNLIGMMPNYPIIICQAIANAQEFSQANLNQLGKQLIHNNFSSNDGLFLFSTIVWNDMAKVCGSGFFYTDSNNSLVVAGGNSYTSS